MSKTRALLLTDVVDSTLLNDRLGDEAMARLWSAHDQAARQLMRSWHGREVGRADGFLVLFDDVPDAVQFALAYHRALRNLSTPLQARVGIHVGPVVLRANSSADTALGALPFEIDGVALPTAARVMSAASGGQTLLSAAAIGGLGSTTLQVASHGHWCLKGLADPLELYEVGDAHVPLTPPPDSPKAYRVVRAGDDWMPLHELPHNLPAERDGFVGRRDALQALARHVETGARLVTLMGIGGIGKTRLAQRFARNRLGGFSGGAWFCDLSAARSIDGLAHAVAQGLGVPLGKTDPLQQLGAAIAGRGSCLIILDNFEQVVRHAEVTVGAWLARAPEAHFIVTSRELLGITGEQVLPLGPLASAEAAALFRQRVRAAGVAAYTDPDDDAAIATLMDVLDRLPLAIELAAARARVMTPRMLLQRMRDRFSLLATRGGRHDRQATMRATLDWSWDLLSAAEQSTLAQLSVFEGGFTLAAAESVIDLTASAPAAPVVDLLQALVERSLVRQPSVARFDLLVTVQDYAAEQLAAEGRFCGSGAAALAAAHGRHGDFFSNLGAAGALADGCADLDNLVVATRRSAAAGRARTAAGALEGAWTAFRLRGPYRVGVELAALVRAIPALDTAAAARVDLVAGWALRASGRIAEAAQRFAAACAGARSAGDRVCEGSVLCQQGLLLLDEGRMEDGRSALAAALQAARETGHRVLECEALTALGSLFEGYGSLDDARRHYEAALATARDAGERRWEGGSLGNLGVLCANQGKLDEAAGFYQAGLAVAREVGDRQWEGNTLCNLGLLQHLQGHLQQAAATLQAALAIAQHLGFVRLECIVRCNLGIVSEALGQPVAACGHYESALRVARALHDPRSEGQVLGYLGLLHARQRRFAEAREHLDLGQHKLTEVSDRLSLALLLCGRAECEHLDGCSDRARGVLEAALAHASAIGAESESELRVALDRVGAMLAGAGS